MIAYNRTALLNLHTREAAGDAFKEALITTDEKANIYRAHPVDLFSPNLFVRIGLGVLTLTILSALMGIVLVAIGFQSPEDWCLVFAIGCVAALEYFVRQKNHFRSGVDDVLLHLAIILLLVQAQFKIDERLGDEDVMLSGYAILLYTLAAIRYLDRLALLLALLSCSLMVYLFFEEIAGRLNFFLLLVHACFMLLLFVMARRMKPRFSEPVITILYPWFEIACLVLLYLSFHYYTAAEVLDLQPLSGKRQDLAPVAQTWPYWLWTIGFPPVVLIYGILRLQREYLRTGLILLLTLLYVQFYFIPVLSAAWTAFVDGILLVGASYGILRYLRKEGSRIIATAPHYAEAITHAEPIAVTAGFSGTGNPGDEGGTRFRGGSFGGGGAGGEF